MLILDRSPRWSRNFSSITPELQVSGVSLPSDAVDVFCQIVHVNQQVHASDVLLITNHYTWSGVCVVNLTGQCMPTYMNCIT